MVINSIIESTLYKAVHYHFSKHTLVFTQTAMVQVRKYVVTKAFPGLPKRSDYEIVTDELGPIKDGEILVKTEWLSIEPYIVFHSGPVPYDQYGFQVGLVKESRDPRFPVGRRVVSHKGCCDYYIINPSEPTKNPQEQVYLLPDLKGLSPSLGVGIVGMPGATAYLGLLDICKPKPGETIVVTGAAGAVGSATGQIAKIIGCRVIGFAGSDEKVRFIEEELGFDKAFNYKKVDVNEALKIAAPNGVDCFFDNVGGEFSNKILYEMNYNGRVALCGAIGSYEMALSQKDDPFKVEGWSHLLPKAPIILPVIVFKQLRVEAFMVWRWLDRWPEAFAQIVDWIKDGQLKPKEYVVEGFDNICEAIHKVFEGENIGKTVLKIS